jgi:hypothetical protein
VPSKNSPSKLLKHFKLGPVPEGFDSPCHIWSGPLDKDGYGRADYQGTRQQAHVFVWRWTKMRDLDPGIELDHLCRTRACVNVEHLEPVTKAVNLSRRKF